MHDVFQPYSDEICEHSPGTRRAPRRRWFLESHACICLARPSFGKQAAARGTCAWHPTCAYGVAGVRALLFDTFQGCDVRTHKISGAVLKGECMLAVQVCPQTGSGVVAAGSAAAVPSDPLHNPSIFQEQCVHARLCVAAPRATFKGTVAGWIRDAGHAVG